MEKIIGQKNYQTKKIIAHVTSHVTSPPPPGPTGWACAMLGEENPDEGGKDVVYSILTQSWNMYLEWKNTHDKLK